MNTLRILALAATVAALAASPAQAGKTTTEIGRFTVSGRGGASFDVIEEDGRRSVVVFTHDRHAINSVYWRISPEKAKELRDMLDKAIQQAEAKSP